MISTFKDLNATLFDNCLKDIRFYHSNKLELQAAARYSNAAFASLVNYLKRGRTFKSFYEMGQKVVCMPPQRAFGAVETYLREIENKRVVFKIRNGKLKMGSKTITMTDFEELFLKSLEYVKVEQPDSLLAAMVNWCIVSMLLQGPFVMREELSRFHDDKSTQLMQDVDFKGITDHKTFLEHFPDPTAAGEIPTLTDSEIRVLKTGILGQSTLVKLQTTIEVGYADIHPNNFLNK
jgi:hypothetical protein